MAVERAVQELATPEPEIITGSREQLLHLLAEAAEIEHTLMCSYLYAAFSLKRPGQDEVTELQSEALARWRKTIIDVAVQEMGHLMIVANLTVAIGGRPHFARPNFPVSSGYFPSGVVARLTPFNAETLEHFVFLERPHGATKQDSEAFEQTDYSRGQAQTGLMPSAQDYATIGHLYEAIRANLRSLHCKLGADRLFLGHTEFQVDHDLIDLDGVSVISDLESATAAIDRVIEQGEGASFDQKDSHYSQFIAIQDELATLMREAPDFAPAWPAATSPVLRRPPPDSETIFVDRPHTAALLDFACASYGLLLRCLVQCFGRSGSERHSQQEALIFAALEMMHIVGEASSALVRLPATITDPSVHAGMTFTMLRGIEPLLTGEAERRILRERAADLLDVCKQVFPSVNSRLHKVRDAIAQL